MDLTALIPILAALFAGGGVAFYTARPKKDSIIADAADKAVDVVTKAIDRQETDLRRQEKDLEDLVEELRKARERIAVLESNLRRTEEATAAALRVTSEATAEALRVSSAATAEALRVTAEVSTFFEARIEFFRAEILRLGGSLGPPPGNSFAAATAATAEAAAARAAAAEAATAEAPDDA
jgi:septal ring factor EnvC (AmiA/AmiB activator)